MSNPHSAEVVQAWILEFLRDLLHLGSGEVLVKDRLVEDLGMDSLDLAEVTMGVEDEFDICLPPDTEWPKTVKDLIDTAVALVKDRK